MEYYLVEKEELIYLITNDLKMTALEQGGVDNWEWYGDSIQDFVKQANIANKTSYEIEDMAKQIVEEDYNMQS